LKGIAGARVSLSGGVNRRRVGAMQIVAAAEWPGMKREKTAADKGRETSERKPRTKAGGRGAKRGGRGGGRGGRGGGSKAQSPPPKKKDLTADGSSAWRIFDVKLPLETDPGKDSFEVTDALRDEACKALGLPVGRSREDGTHLLKDGETYGVRVVRKSCDARKVGDVGFSYVLDVDDVCVDSATVAGGSIKKLDIRPKPKKLERVRRDWDDEVALDFDSDSPLLEAPNTPSRSSTDDDERVVVVGLGPAGLFAALALTEAGVPVTVLERGQPVESRGRDIGALFARRVLDADSNLCYGEGGAGTWSDGKLTTRIGRNSDDVRVVLKSLVAFGAPPEILVTGKPHLGTDRLVRVLRNAREYLVSKGAEIRFGCTVDQILFENTEDVGDGRVKRACGVVVRQNGSETPERLESNAVILASGHSARNLMEHLLTDGIELKYQPFAAGFRIEHPQVLLNELQYGEDLAPLASKGKGPLPVADYRLAHQCKSTGEVSDVPGAEYTQRACYSFCMCPGGQIVPTSTVPTELCVNGMSFSKRGSRWANSGLVSTITESDAAPFCTAPGREALAGLDFQRHIERKASEMGGGDLTVPVQTAPDFIEGKATLVSDLPTSSYRLGVVPARLDLLYPPAVTDAVRESLIAFDRKMPGFAGPSALLHAPEARTSSPVRVVRDTESYQSATAAGLFPVGEGAGYAGGIVSAAVDGLLAAGRVGAFVGGV